LAGGEGRGRRHFPSPRLESWTAAWPERHDLIAIDSMRWPLDVVSNDDLSRYHGVKNMATLSLPPETRARHQIKRQRQIQTKSRKL
jgi:hypothetical protein